MLEKTSPNSSYLSKKHSSLRPKQTQGTHPMNVALIPTYELFPLTHTDITHPATREVRKATWKLKEMFGVI